MQQNLSDIILFPKGQSILNMKKLPAKRPFDDDVCEFLNAVALLIMKDKVARKYPDIITFGFFCRKANLENLKRIHNYESRIGRGLSFHIAPSNVPINFAYSMVAGLLAGDSVVVRVSTKEFEQTKIICEILKKAAEQTTSKIEKYIAVVQYGHNKEITDSISALCDVRVIWGGDNTISEIRKSALPPRGIEITFADRYSVCVLNAEKVLAIKDWNTFSQSFYNDTYLYDQNACSSPRLIYWVGEKTVICKAQEAFWSHIFESIAPKYKIEPVIAVDKLTMDYRVAIEENNVEIVDDNNLFHRVKLQNLETDITKYMCPGGSFLEYEDTDISALANIVNKKYQTLSYYGFDAKDLSNWVIDLGLEGIDRIVPIGKTADFTLIWDGYDLIETMSRRIYSE